MSIIYKLQLNHSAISNREPLGTAAAMLLRAFQYAKNARCNPWQFAIELEEFYRAGVSKSELRWLTMTGLVWQAVEILDSDCPSRKFKSSALHSLPVGTCFILSDCGIAKLSEWKNRANHLSHLNNGVSFSGQDLLYEQTLPNQPARERIIPEWDQEQKELRLNEVVVKQFSYAAPNQETILAAFQEEHWLRRIDDPLHPIPDLDSRQRLNNTIKCLNRNQDNPLILFRGDGTGTGIQWQARLEVPKALGQQ